MTQGFGFRDPITAGDVLIRFAIRSPNYVTGASGWTINKDGTSEFSDSIIRGTVIVGSETGPHIELDPDMEVGFNQGFLQAVLSMFTDDPHEMMQSMIGAVVYQDGQANAQMNTVIHSPITDGGAGQGFGIVLAANSDDNSLPANAGIGPVTLSGDAMTHVPAMMVETYGVSAQAFLVYSTSPSPVVSVFQTAGVHSFTPPAGVTSIMVECWGGGGNGAASPGAAGGGGGGGGEYAAETALAVTPGTPYSFTVGANVASSVFAGDAVTVRGHSGVSGSGSAGGVGGTGSTNTIHNDGGFGASTVFSGGAGGGGAGGNTATGSHGNGGQATGQGGAGGLGGLTGGGSGGAGGNTSGGNGKVGSGPGGGGGGAGSGSSRGLGATGQVRITYQPVGVGIAASLAAVAGTDKLGNTYPAGIYNGTKRVMDQADVQTFDVAASTNLTLTNVMQDVPNMSVTFTTLFPNAEVTIQATFDILVGTAIGAGGLCVCQCVVDGSTLPRTPYTSGSSADRRLAPGAWRTTLAAAGSHTIKFQADKSINAGVATLQSSVTGGSITVIDRG